MKRLARRTLGVMIGLALGWYAAGAAQETDGPWSSVSYAQDATTATPSPANDHDQRNHVLLAVDDHDPHKATFEQSFTGNGHATTGHGSSSHDGHHGDDIGLQTAELLMPQSRQQVCWFRPVVMTAGGLFIGAVVLGMPALALRGPEPEDPADLHDDDHAQDDHH